MPSGIGAERAAASNNPLLKLQTDNLADIATRDGDRVAYLVRGGGDGHGTTVYVAYRGYLAEVKGASEDGVIGPPRRFDTRDASGRKVPDRDAIKAWVAKAADQPNAGCNAAEIIGRDSHSNTEKATAFDNLMRDRLREQERFVAPNGDTVQDIHREVVDGGMVIHARVRGADGDLRDVAGAGTSLEAAENHLLRHLGFEDQRRPIEADTQEPVRDVVHPMSTTPKTNREVVADYVREAQGYIDNYAVERKGLTDAYDKGGHLLYPRQRDAVEQRLERADTLLGEVSAVYKDPSGDGVVIRPRKHDDLERVERLTAEIQETRAALRSQANELTRRAKPTESSGVAPGM
jgi:hypothetical protein